MLYPYVTLGDGTEVLHTGIHEENGMETVEVHFERPIENGFMTARFVLPTYELIERDNVSDEELKFLIKLLECNAHLIYKYAKCGGAVNA